MAVHSQDCHCGSGRTKISGCSIDAALQKAVNLTRRSSHRVKWIRLRLLAGTSSLNGMMARITGGARSSSCPVCGNGPETVLYFLRSCHSCHATSSIDARTHYEAKVNRSFEDLSELQQCAFILGCVVAVDTEQIAASPAEDLASLTLVETLWDKRCAALTSGAPLGLNGNINNVRRRYPRCGTQGVGAHGIATLSN